MISNTNKKRKKKKKEDKIRNKVIHKNMKEILIKDKSREGR